MINLLYYAFVGVAVVLIYFAWQQYQVTQNILQTGTKTTAKVIELLPRHSTDGTTYCPVFEYKDVHQNVHTYESLVSSQPPAYRVGERVLIVYNQDRSIHKTISFWGLYRYTIILFCIAMPLLVIGGGYVLYELSLNHSSF